MNKINYFVFLTSLAIVLSGFFGSTPSAQAALVDIEACSDGLFAGGDGTEGDPWQISTSTELENVTFCSDNNNQGNYFILTNDIDLEGFQNRYDAGEWLPIGSYIDESTYMSGSFYGTFDGNYHVIRNLSINREEYGQGLFATLDEDVLIQNIGLEDTNITGKSAGGIVGDMYGTIRTSYVKDSTITSTEQFNPSGGIAGYMSGIAFLENSYVFNITVRAQSEGDAGGIIGRTNSGAHIDKVYASGNVSVEIGDTGSAGGIIGEGYPPDQTLENSFSVAEVSSDSLSSLNGGLSGSKWGEELSVGSNNYWYLPEENGLENCVGDDALNDPAFCTSVDNVAYFKDAENEPLASWDIANTDNTDYENYNGGYPFLSWERDGGSAETIWSVYGAVEAIAPTLSAVTPIPSEVYIDDAKYYFNLNNPDEVAGNFLVEEVISDDLTAEVIVSIEEEYLTIRGLEVGYTYSTAFTFAYNDGTEYTETLEVGPFTVIERKNRKNGSRVSPKVNSPSTTSTTPVSTTPSSTTGTTDSPSVNTSTEVRDLTLTFEGEDVKMLQQILIAKNTGPKALALAGIGATGYFGTYTRDALAEYQAPNGIVPAIGYFGSITRAQMKAAGLTGLWW